MKTRLVSKVGLLAGLSVPGLALAGNENRPTFYMDTQFSLSTVKSKMLLANDTGTALRYGWGTYAGDDGQLNFQIMNDSETTTFSLNDSSLYTAWHDASMRYFLGPFYLGAVLSHADLKSTNQAVESIDAAGFGYGLTTGLMLDIGKQSSLRVDILTVSIAEMKNALEGAVSVGQRLDIDIGGSTGLGFKWLDFTFGYRVRNLTIKSDASYQEAFYHTYGGLRLMLNF